eukprot:7376913-Prymnesium_polylepis.1
MAAWSTSVTPNAFKYAQYDSHVTHVATADEQAGTVLTMADFDNTLDLGDHADQLLVYQGTSTNPMFLCALDNAGGHTSWTCTGSVGGWHQDSCPADRPWTHEYFSALPPGLTDGVDALAWPQGDNY